MKGFVLSLAVVAMLFASVAVANDGGRRSFVQQQQPQRLFPLQALRLNVQNNRDFRQTARGASVQLRQDAIVNGFGQFRQQPMVQRVVVPQFFVVPQAARIEHVRPSNRGRIIIINN